MNWPEPLNGLAEAQRTALERVLEPVEFDPGSTIFKAGTVGDCCFLVESGRVRIEMGRSELDSDDVLGFVEAGAILGELSLLDGKPRSASAIADSPVRALRLAKSELERLSQEQPQAAAGFYAALGRSAALKLRSTNERLADLAFTSHDPEVEELVERARAAIREFESWPEDRVDHLLLLLAQTIAVEAKSLAEATVRITRMGNVPDKVAKNLMASLGVYRHLVGQTGGGALATDQERKVIELASPAGVVFGLVPMTNPVATAIFKSLVALKGRNALILSFHRVAAELAAMVGERLQSVLRAEGAPVDLIQWVRQRNSRKKTELFMRHPKVSLILATGGASMVRAAYSSGTPAIGVGPGNAPTLVCRDADLDHAAASVVLSKSFDNGLICGSDNNLVAVAATVLELTDALVRHRAAVLAPEETERLTAQAVQPDSHRLRGKFIGQSAAWICEQVGIGRDYPIRAIVVPTEAVRADNVYACEKMAPIVSLFTVADEDDGLALSLALLQLEGAGHTAIIHTRNPELVQRFGALMPASRILVNSPGSQGVIGFTTGLVPSLMLGCGTFGHTSTTDNISLRHLINIKRIAHFTL